jgi:hypothetical protein
MLSLHHHPQTGQEYLTIRNDFAKAWIEHYPRLGDHLEHLGEIPDWRLWVAPPGRPASRQKSPTRLLIESQLRAWVLRRCGRCLPTLTFAELVRITQGLPVPAPPRVYHDRDGSRPRSMEKLDRHRATLKSHMFDTQKWHN